MFAELLTQLATTGGPVGAALAVAYLYIRTLHRDLREVQEKRVTDQQSMITRLLTLNDRWMETVNAQVDVAEGQKQLLVDLKAMIQDIQSRRR